MISILEKKKHDWYFIQNHATTPHPPQGAQQNKAMGNKTFIQFFI